MDGPAAHCGRELRRARCVRRRGSASTRRRTSTGCPTSASSTGRGCTIISLQVEFADTARHDADVVSAPRSTTRPGITCSARRPSSGPGRSRTSASSRSTPIRSASSAYLRELYVDLGRRFPTLPPQRAGLRPFRITVGPVTDVRVKEEREPPPRARGHLVPDPKPGPVPRPRLRREGCLTWLLRALLALLRLLQPPLQAHAGARSRLLRGSGATAASGSSPIRAAAGPDQARGTGRPRRSPVPLRHEATARAAELATPRATRAEDGRRQGDRAHALRGGRWRMRSPLATPPSTSRARSGSSSGPRASSARQTSPPQKPRLDFHQALGALADYPELMRELGLVVRLGSTVQRRIRNHQGDREVGRADSPERRLASDALQLESSEFGAAHKPGSDLAEGMLDLVDAGDSLADRHAEASTWCRWTPTARPSRRSSQRRRSSARISSSRRTSALDRPARGRPRNSEREWCGRTAPGTCTST